jgi:hypothetical protein
VDDFNVKWAVGPAHDSGHVIAGHPGGPDCWGVVVSDGKGRDQPACQMEDV